MDRVTYGFDRRTTHRARTIDQKYDLSVDLFGIISTKSRRNFIENYLVILFHVCHIGMKSERCDDVTTRLLFYSSCRSTTSQ
jgi:hypothetical protein